MPAFQETIPNNYCWGCGMLNASGLHLKSYWDGDEAVCRVQLPGEFSAAPPHVAYGGIIAAIFDCHCVCTAYADSYRAAGREMGSEPVPAFVTASLKVDYLAPTLIDQPLEVRARIREVKGRRRTVESRLLSGGRECARAEVIAVEVPADTWGAPTGGATATGPGSPG